MKLAAEFRLPWRRIGRYVLAAGLIFQVVVIVVVVASERASRRAERARMTFNLNPDVQWVDNPSKPILDPPILNAAAASIRPEEMVIGVEAGGKARAYRLAALEDPSGHLVDDRIGEVPVLVSYCNLSRCVRVFTDSRGAVPLDAEVVGLLNGEMVIKVKGILYFQKSGMPVEPDKRPPAIPYSRLDPTLTSWETWERLHPGTDVYVGAVDNRASRAKWKLPSYRHALDHSHPTGQKRDTSAG